MQNKTFYLYHNSLLALPIVGPLFYKFQILLLKNRLLNNVFISNRNWPQRDSILVRFNIQTVVKIKSSKFGRILKKIKAIMVLDCPEINLEIM